MYEKYITFFIAFMAFALLVIPCININAHEAMLNVEYDNCIEHNGDGEYETWYWLIWCNREYHISHEVTTITYYFADSLENSSYTWTTDLSDEEAEIIKNAYADSMKKWNDVYYYSYDDNSNRTACKIINVVEGNDESSSNLIIYPTSYGESGTVANTFKRDVFEFPLEINGELITHYHHEKWGMRVNIDSFKSSHYYSKIHQDAVGAHELGHVLGIYDVDMCCSNASDTAVSGHHEEILMGYGDEVRRSTDVQYKDIAGVAITRGFHTDDDHVWMLRSNTDGTKDVICAQCNGVRYNIALTDGKYEGKTVNPYQSCIHHGGTNEKMLLVATDGERNFFKCQYCRRIETVDLSDNVVLDPYTPIDISRNVYGHDNKYIKITVNHRDTYTFKATPIDGLSVMLYDSNLNSVDLVIDDVFTSEGSDVYLDIGTYYLRIDNSKSSSITAEMTVSPPPHTHEYTQWKFLSDTHHIEQCECGQVGHATGYHVIEGGTGAVLRGKCIYCKSMIFLGNNTFPGIMSMMKYSVNGSYILPNGIIVLVDEDIEAYLNGTLVFYDKDNLPVVQ